MSEITVSPETSPLLLKVAEACHEANRELQKLTGEEVNGSWDEISEDMRQSTLAGVVEVWEGTTPEKLHQHWCMERMAAGWRWGPVKDPATKEHPCLVNYNQLPLEQKVKDILFQGIAKMGLEL